MATPVLMPKQGQSVETCLILEWRKQPGDSVAEGDILCEVETDKATFEVESPAAGTLLTTFFEEGDDAPVLVNIAVIGDEGEATDEFKPAGAADEAEAEAEPEAEPEPAAAAPPKSAAPAASQAPAQAPASAPVAGGDEPERVSPRARKLAAEKGVSVAGITGTGPHGRVIERDVQAALDSGQPLTPAARELAAQGMATPSQGTGIGGRVTSGDMQQPAAAAAAPGAPVQDEITEVPIKGIRKLIAERMHASLAETAQLTMNGSADASSILAYRKKLKGSDEDLGLQKVTITDLILYVVSRVLRDSPEMNAIYQDGTLYQYKNVHLALAVDTPRGLMVPVIRNADRLSLKQISDEAKRLAGACLEGKIDPDDLSGGTFTITNLGAFGIESFTPVINPPQVGILGISNTQLKAVLVDGEVQHLPHLGLSLTIDHQVVDGAPAARFLQKVAAGLGNIDLQLALG